MNFLIYISESVIPLTIFVIVGYAILTRHSVYNDFVNGAKGGMHTVIDIIPTMLGLMLGVGALSSSGLLTDFTHFLASFTSQLGIPAAILPPAIIKMFSSSAATGLVLDIFKEYGPDSYEGLTASLIMCSTETIFYTMSVYFLSVGVTKTRFTLPGALLCTLSGIIMSIIIACYI